MSYTWKKIETTEIKVGQRVLNIGRHNRYHWEATIMQVGVGIVQIQYDPFYWKGHKDIWDLDPLGCRWIQLKSLRRYFEVLEEETMNNEDKKFFMVMGEGRPHVRHSSLYSANVEAERLAKQHPNTDFFVLQAVSVTRVNNVVRKELV